MFKGFGYLLMIYTLYVQDCSVYKYDLQLAATTISSTYRCGQTSSNLLFCSIAGINYSFLYKIKCKKIQKCLNNLQTCNCKSCKVRVTLIKKIHQQELAQLASERSERDTYRGNAIENRGRFFIQRASEASEADSQSCSIEISDIYILVVCLSTNGERALNYTVVK